VRRSRSPLVYVGQATAVVTLITGILSLVFIARPGCKPTLPPDKGIGEIQKPPAVLSPVTFKSYLRKLELPTGTLSAEQLGRVGVMVEFHYKVYGFGGKKLPLHWELDDAQTNDVVAGDRALIISPSTNEEGREFFIWVPVPKTRRTYYVVGRLFQPGGTVPIDDFKTRDFDGLAKR
jgi:hypothetical protein